MNILFVSDDCMSANLAVLLKKEGHHVKLYIKNKNSRQDFDNLVEKTKSWKKELNWVGKNGLIIFDDIGYGKEQDKLRKKGYKVFGGSEIGDKIETDREFGQQILRQHGLKTVELKDFKDIEEAISFVKKNPKKWVIKCNDHSRKFITYIGEFSDGRDVISVLKNYFNNRHIDRERITLHERVEGVEMGVGRYFNGHHWVGPIEINFEHTRMFPDDVGPVTSEMGTLAWYDEDENNKLYQEVLHRCGPYLEKIGFRGDFEINCIVNESGAHPLEVTARLGTPIIHLHSEIHETPWGDLLYAIASGNDIKVKYKKGYGIVNLVATPPFPYGRKNSKETLYGTNIYFRDISENEMKSVHLEGVSLRLDKNTNQYFISSHEGYILYTTAVADTIEIARKKSLSIIKKIIIPKSFYRDDIGEKFEREDQSKSKKWGYI